MGIATGRKEPREVETATLWVIGDRIKARPAGHFSSAILGLVQRVQVMKYSQQQRTEAYECHVGYISTINS